MTDTLLIELLTEELPPKALNRLGESFAAAVAAGLEKEELTEGAPVYTAYASPRRLAVSVQAVRGKQPDRTVIRKGPSVAAGLKDGMPTKALEGFARANGVPAADLQQTDDGKQQVFSYTFEQNGETLDALLDGILAAAVKQLPIPKVMRWGANTHTFVRPVHGLTVLHGSRVISAQVLGLAGGNTTLGHRFLSRGEIVIARADDYAWQMREEGFVMAGFAERRAVIEKGLAAEAARIGSRVDSDEALVDEVTALVEWPVVLSAGFEADFLEVPQECLILTMKQNQKYFPLLDGNDQLTNRFLLVSNLQADDPGDIIRGNERVLRARLSDAEFFFKQDRKKTLAERLSGLAQVVYHNKLGSQADRAARIEKLALEAAAFLQADSDLTARAAQLCKADLLTEMVGEFPELQGTMGKYYARHDGEPEAVANAIEQHYRPRFAGDVLPDSPVAAAVALADKLETLTGIYGIGLIPTGDKDPFALRRTALGILRMVMAYKLELMPLLSAAEGVFPQGMLAEHTADAIAGFMSARLAVLLQQDYPHDEVAAVLAVLPLDPAVVPEKLAAVAGFKKRPEAAALAAANKRVHNLLKKADAGVAGHVNPALLTADEEKNLYAAVTEVGKALAPALQARDFSQALTLVAGLRGRVDAFFEHVMVMDKDDVVRSNRLALLKQLSLQLNAVADISLLDDAAPATA